jgi:DNA-binding transcriptional LysR family regulator
MDLLKAMESFVRAARAGSFAAAAAQSDLSRAIVGKHIQDLENHLGVRLFFRTTRRLALTEAGAEYKAFCERLLEEISEQREALGTLQQTTRGALKIMAPKSFGNIHLSPTIAEFSERHPQINVSLILADDPMNGRYIVENGLDAAIRLSPAPDSSVVSRRIGFLRWQLCAAPSYLRARGTPSDPGELAGHNCLMHLRTTPDRTWRLRGPHGEAAVKVGGSFAANSSLALRSGALRGLGIALLPSYCVSGDLAAGRLVKVLPDDHIEPRPVFLLYPNRRHLPAKVRLLIDFLVDRFSKDGWDEARV